MYAGGYGSVAAAWWAHHAVAAGLLLPHSAFPQQQQPQQQQTRLDLVGPLTGQPMHAAGPPSPAMGCSSPTRRFTPEKAKFREYKIRASRERNSIKKKLGPKRSPLLIPVHRGGSAPEPEHEAERPVLPGEREQQQQQQQQLRRGSAQLRP